MSARSLEELYQGNEVLLSPRALWRAYRCAIVKFVTDVRVSTSRVSTLDVRTTSFLTWGRWSWGFLFIRTDPALDGIAERGEHERQAEREPREPFHADERMVRPRAQDLRAQYCTACRADTYRRRVHRCEARPLLWARDA